MTDQLVGSDPAAIFNLEHVEDMVHQGLWIEGNSLRFEDAFEGLQVGAVKELDPQAASRRAEASRKGYPKTAAQGNS